MMSDIYSCNFSRIFKFHSYSKSSIVLIHTITYTKSVWLGGAGVLESQLSAKFLAIFQLSVKSFSPSLSYQKSLQMSYLSHTLKIASFLS